jgi:hypothetical protein
MNPTPAHPDPLALNDYRCDRCDQATGTINKLQMLSLDEFLSSPHVRNINLDTIKTWISFCIASMDTLSTSTSVSILKSIFLSANHYGVKIKSSHSNFSSKIISKDLGLLWINILRFLLLNMNIRFIERKTDLRHIYRYLLISNLFFVHARFSLNHQSSKQSQNIRSQCKWARLNLN